MNLNEVVERIYREKFKPKKFVPGETPVPVSGKVFDERELIAMIEAVLDGHWTEGRFAREFEAGFSRFLGMQHCVTVNSGSSANLLALSALTSFRVPKDRRLKKGDEVIVSATSFPTTVNPIVQCGLVPVFVDPELGTYNPTPDVVRQAISSRTKAVFLAHTLGNPFLALDIQEVCEEAGMWLIEDNCDALGAKCGGRYTGTIGDLSTYSFYPAHHITMAEGGAVCTNSNYLNRIVRSFRDWGRDCYCPTGVDNTCGKRFDWTLGNLPSGYDHKYVYSEIGYNLKTTDIQAALGLAQLHKLEGFIAKRKENFEHLLRLFRELEEYFILPLWEDSVEPSWFGFPLTIRSEAGFLRRELLTFLDQQRIGTRLLFASNLTKQPSFVNYDIPYRVYGELSNADVIMHNTFWLGVYPGLTEEMLNYAFESVRVFLKTR